MKKVFKFKEEFPFKEELLFFLGEELIQECYEEFIDSFKGDDSDDYGVNPREEFAALGKVLLKNPYELSKVLEDGQLPPVIYWKHKTQEEWECFVVQCLLCDLFDEFNKRKK